MKTKAKKSKSAAKIAEKQDLRDRLVCESDNVVAHLKEKMAIEDIYRFQNSDEFYGLLRNLVLDYIDGCGKESGGKVLSQTETAAELNTCQSDISCLLRDRREKVGLAKLLRMFGASGGSFRVSAYEQASDSIECTYKGTVPFPDILSSELSSIIVLRVNDESYTQGKTRKEVAEKMGLHYPLLSAIVNYGDNYHISVKTAMDGLLSSGLQLFVGVSNAKTGKLVDIIFVDNKESLPPSDPA